MHRPLMLWVGAYGATRLFASAIQIGSWMAQNKFCILDALGKDWIF